MHVCVCCIYIYIYMCVCVKIESLGITNLKGPDFRNSRKKHSRTTLREKPNCY